MGHAVQEIITSRPGFKPSRNPEIRRYTMGADAGRAAAIEAYNHRITPGGTWQHALLEHLQITDQETKGWVVGYCAELQALSRRNTK
jgi:hypothetical protein